MEPIDRIQRRLLREIGLSEIEALQHFRLAPLPTRRDIAMLGLLHRISLGKAPPQLACLFPLAPVVPRRFRALTRLHRIVQRHSRQFLERPAHTDCFKRSLFGLVSSYNLLPQSIVDIQTVSGFQSRLQSAVLRAANNGVENWALLLSQRWLCRQAEFQRLFDE